ncbi:MAG: response regulator [Planctomycetes bacterium]|nr:response regulator [Planctomycetota bacterium]
MPANDDPRPILRSNPEQITAVLDRLDCQAAGCAAVSRRRFERYRYRMSMLTVEFVERDGAPGPRYAVPSRNISRGGAAYLFGNFVYPGARCRTHLRTIHDQTVVATGEIAHCRYVERSALLHEAGVRFDRPVDVELYHRGATRVRVLLVAADPAMHQLVAALLKARQVELAWADCASAAVDLALSAGYDLILVDMDRPDLDGYAAVRALRERGYANPIVALTTATAPEVPRGCLELGCSAWVTQPITRAALVRLIDAARIEPLVSSPRS